MQGSDHLAFGLLIVELGLPRPWSADHSAARPGLVSEHAFCPVMYGTRCPGSSAVSLGRGRRPPEGGTTVYVSAVIDRMLSIDDTNYRFEVGKTPKGWVVACKIGVQQ